jgi:outer membrane protein assembly factor BamB
VLHTVHYQTEARSFSATPVLTGTTLWVGGDDGRLTALRARDGEVRWSTDLGVPILAPLVPAEPGILYVATFDGTVQALAHDPDARPSSSGCAVSHPGNSAPPLWFLVLLTPFFRRRKD